MAGKPRMFIGSSAENLDLACAIQEGLDHFVECTVWSQGIFSISRTSMASLIDQLDEIDFAAIVLSPDDVTKIRGKENNTIRDNVVFELGLFAGRLSVERCFLVVPRGADGMHLPTDLAGITTADFDADRQDGNLVAALGPACNRIRKAISKIALPNNVPQAVDVAIVLSDLCENENDCVSLIESWMSQRSTSNNLSLIRFDEVDSILKMVPGSSRKYIARAGSRWGYFVKREGRHTILFTDGKL